MIEQLIDALHAKELHPTAEEIADLLWLAEQMGAPTYNQAAAFAHQNAQRAQVETADGDEPWDHDDKRSDQPPPDAQRNASQQPGANAQLPPDPDGEDGEKGPGGLPFRSPGSAALPGALALARALRHLKRRVPSLTQLRLDEEATVRHIVDTDDWSPVQKPASARWLDVVLVIDESSSMVVWEQLITEFHQLLERQGAFRAVRRWYMATDPVLNETALYAERGGATRNAPRRNATELLDPQGQRLILVLSDCVSAGWVDGTVAGMLKVWSDKGMVALVQMLPQQMWQRTALRSGSQLYLRSSQPGMVNARLEQHIPRRRRRQREANDPKPEGVVLPVVTLEAEQLLPWAKLVAGANVQWTPGVVLPLAPVLEQETDLVAQPPLTAEERVQRFFATASPAAQALAGYLSTVPLSLGVIRVVQRAMFKERSRQVHLAEVLLSGLVEQRRQVTYAKSDDIRYEFFPGVRERLQDTVLEGDAVRVLAEVSNFVNTHTGQPIDFRALLNNPALAGEIAWEAGTQRFAVVAVEVLWRFGGRYAELAKVLEPANFISSLKFDKEQESAAKLGSKDEGHVLEQKGNERIRNLYFEYSASHFVNREQEIALIRQRLGEMVNNQLVEKRTFIFTGEHGIGNSWLLQHLHQLLQEQNGVKVVHVDLATYMRESSPEAIIYKICTEISDSLLLKDYILHRDLKIAADLLLNKIQQEILSNNILVVLLDTVYQSPHQLLAMLEDYLLGHLVINRNVLFVMAGRGREYPWSTPELRLQAEFRTLPPLDKTATAQQVYIATPNMVSHADEIYRISCGNPKMTLLLASNLEIIDSISLLDQIIDEMLPPSAPQVIREHMEALAVFRQFDYQNIPHILSFYYNDQSLKSLPRRELRLILDRLLEPGLIYWNTAKLGYTLHEATRYLILVYLRLAKPELWRRLHESCIILYQNWVGDKPKNWENWQKELDYHQRELSEQPPTTVNDRPSNTPSAKRKLKVLFLAANPVDTPQLRLDEEVRAIDQALRKADYRDRFDFIQHRAVQYGDLQELLLRHQPDLVHFSGHGSETGELLLQGENGIAHPIREQTLSRLFSVLKDNIRCVVLNACYSESQATAIAQHIDVVIGMKHDLGDEAARNFAAAFYQGLGYGRSVQTAFDLGCLQIDLANLGEEDAPKLKALRGNPAEAVLVKA